MFLLLSPMIPQFHLTPIASAFVPERSLSLRLIRLSRKCLCLQADNHGPGGV
jgi:hypothetical protein